MNTLYTTNIIAKNGFKLKMIKTKINGLINTPKISIFWAFFVLLAYNILVWKNSYAQQDQTKSNQKVVANRNFISQLPEVIDAIEQRRNSYRQELKQKIDNHLSNSIFGDEKVVTFTVEVDLEKFQKAVEQSAKMLFGTIPNPSSRSKIALQFLETLNSAQFSAFVKPILLKVALSENISPSQRPLLEQSLQTAVDLPKGSSWQIKFERLASAKTQNLIESTLQEKNKIEKDAAIEKQKLKEETERIARDREAIARAKDSADGERRTLEIKLKQEQDKNTFLQSEIDKLKTLTDEQKTRISKFEEELSIYKTPLGELKKLIKGLELPLTVFPIFILLMLLLTIGMAVLNAAQRKRVGIMKESVELIAGALSKIGGKATAGGQLQKAIEAELIAKNNPSALSPAENAHEQLSAGGSGALSAEMERLKSEAELAWRECQENPYLTQCILKEWLQGGASGIAKFVALSSTLSPVEAAQLTNAFAPEETKALSDVVPDLSYRLRGYSVTISLFRSILEMGANQKSFLKGANFPAIVRANDKQLATAIFAEDAQQRIQIFDIIPQPRWKRVLDKAAEIFPQELLAQCIAQYTGAASPSPAELTNLAKQVDGELANAINNSVQLTARSKVQQLAEGLDQLSPKVKAAITLAQQQFPDFAAVMEQATVTFDAVLKLDKNILQELLEPLESEEMAQLLCSVDGSKRQFLAGLMSEKLKITVEADFNRFSASKSSLKRAESDGVRIQNQLISKAKALAAEGIVDLTSPNSATQQEYGRSA